MLFLLGDDAREQAKKSIKALASHARSLGSAHVPLYLVLNTTIFLVKEKDYTPRIIPVTHKLHNVGDKAILLISRDLAFREPLTQKELPTEDTFHQIIPFQKIKLMAHSPKALLRLFRENDIVMADARIFSKLPDILGSQFYGKNKKVPFKVQMAKPIPGQRSKGKIDHLVDPKYVQRQVSAILANTYFIPPANGTCIHIVVGYADWKVSELLTNINDIISYLVDEKNLPVGGLLRKVDNLHSVLIKTSDSVAMPVMKKDEKIDDESDNSDLDF